MDKDKCSYCRKPFDRGEHSKTAEHIFPRGIIELFPEQNISFLKGKTFIDNRGLVIKDVCQKCNSSYLSKLDKYGKHLISTQFLLPIPTEKMNERYSKEIDYHLVLRWLLKITYNDRRREKKDCSWFQTVIGYILHGILVENFDCHLYAGMHVNTTPLPEDFYNYMPMQINENPKLLGNSLSISVYGINPLINSVSLPNSYTYCIRLGTAVFFIVLWKHEATPADKLICSTLLESEFNFIRIKDGQSVYTLQRVAAHSNTVAGYAHLVSTSGLEQDNNIVSSLINNRELHETQTLMNDMRSPIDKLKSKALVEMSIFPNNEAIQKNMRDCSMMNNVTIYINA